MFYVYSLHIDSGKQDYVNQYETAKEAVEKIRNCYNADSKSAMINEYYYFMKERK